MTATQEQEPVIQAVPDLPEETPLSPEQMAERITTLEHELQQAGQTMVQFKAKVRTEAMTMAEHHGLCEVVEQTLTRIGISVVKVKFEVVQSIERVRTVEMPEDLVNALTEAELEAYLRDNRVPQGRRQREFRAVQSSVNRDRNVGTVTIRRAETARPVERGGIAMPEGYTGAFTSREGRSMHLLHVEGGADDRGRIPGTQRMRALCGAETYSPQDWYATSPRDNGSICRRCAERSGLVVR